jgi:integrase
MEQIRQAEVYGVRPKRTFRMAATKYLNEKEKRSLNRDAMELKKLDPFIGGLTLEQVHMGSLRSFIEFQRTQKKKNRTINYGLQVVRHILNLASGEWMDEFGLTWLHVPPKIKLLKLTDERKPYPISWAEQDLLFHELPIHLRRMALFAVNTGCRDHEICSLRWDWEMPVHELDTSIFVVPGHNVKNGEDRLIVLNSISRKVVEECRGIHPDFVFTYNGHPIKAMNKGGWREARERAGLPWVRVHDLKHTFGCRLRAAGVSFQDQKDLLGHKSGNITDRYTAGYLENLIQAAEKVVGDQGSRKSPALIFLKQRFNSMYCR